MPYYDIKKVEFTIKQGSGTLKSSCGSIGGFKRPSSQFEANKMAEEWLKKRYPNCTIIDLKVTLR
ncbi:MAG: hypothetical protein E7370_03635 [Clostridiales bacterium]|nr:hypothetical protein [Clostridiales bacterium]